MLEEEIARCFGMHSVDYCISTKVKIIAAEIEEDGDGNKHGHRNRNGDVNDDIKDIAREQGLDIYHDRDEILEIITNRIFECKYD